ncbi:hypothetical protein [Chromobacterium subtsugae]|uniref:hypothetical protein n=1 Tax=Chromobacterium subtsugae TaxID=251747 RepID=UPI000A5CC48B|nr:hypothetical protein [Chromobacterium subtsugae]
MSVHGLVVRDAYGRVALHTDALAGSLVDVISLTGGAGERHYPEFRGYAFNTLQIYGATVGGPGKRMHAVSLDYAPGYPLLRWWQQTGDVAPTTLYVLSAR